MEFSIRLKELRKEKNVSQQALANAIFVSRSAVAKWENGLGIPSEESYLALLSYFNCSVEELPLHEEKEVLTVRKNKTIRKLVFGALCLIMTVCVLSPFILIFAAANGFGLTADIAAGNAWRDHAYISTSHYVFYYDVISIKAPAESGTEVVAQPIDHFCTVEKRALGYKRLDVELFKKRVFADNGNEIGYLYTFPGVAEYCYFFLSSKVAESEAGLTVYLFDEIQIKEDTLSLLHYSYFTYPFEIVEFDAYGVTYTVK